MAGRGNGGAEEPVDVGGAGIRAEEVVRARRAAGIIGGAHGGAAPLRLAVDAAPARRGPAAALRRGEAPEVEGASEGSFARSLPSL